MHPEGRILILSKDDAELLLKKSYKIGKLGGYFYSFRKNI
jgi:hypothetical protein